MSEELTVVGRLTSVYGIKGWVKVFSYTDPMTSLFGYKPWQVKRGAELLTLKVEEWKPHGKGLIAKLAGMDSPEQAKQFCGLDILVPLSVLPDPGEDEYYWHQLENLLVYTESGVLLGRVDHLMETGSNDVLVVRGTAESLDRQERLIPYLPDQVIKEINLDEGLMRVDWDPEF